ncbi:hypothetical protein SAMN05443292_1977 [Halpernia frigidisoli]|uniref:Outer membrane protein n=1 Tax=Halpernia frigidisoli TaxID=1125876 RepID=A0A1I3GQQ5_9FLAO|nr:hypothetical protein SAMN05443292_1977 [Halpernia frigidisoli]
MVFGQKTADSTKLRFKYKPNFMVGFDVVNAGVSAFADRKLFQGFISTNYNNKIHLVADAGFEKNIYVKNGYDAKASGPFVKIGGFYMLASDRENPENGFYAGGKLAASYYNQQYFAVPVRGFQGIDVSQAFPSSTQSSFWIEGAIGGRVQLFQSKFYIDVNLQPKYLAYTTKQEEIIPLLVPGFGKSSTKFNFGFAWNLAYKF